MTRTHCLNTKTCSCYYLAACCTKKSNTSWSERKNGPINLPSGPQPWATALKDRSRHFSPLFKQFFFHTPSHRCTGQTASPGIWHFLYILKQLCKELLAGSSPEKGKPRTPVTPVPPRAVSHTSHRSAPFVPPCT